MIYIKDSLEILFGLTNTDIRIKKQEELWGNILVQDKS